MTTAGSAPTNHLMREKENKGEKKNSVATKENNQKQEE